MYNVSQQYKEQMKQPIRNQSYMRIMLGLINQEAQMSAEVENQSQYTTYSEFPTLFTKNDIGNMYATYEQDFWKADGSMYFLPRSPTNYRQNGLITESLFSGTPLIQFSFVYGASDIRGLTIQFGHNYPTEFSVITDDGTEVDFENSSDYFETTTIFENTSTITLKIKAMSVPNNRIRLFYVRFGLGIQYDNEWIITADSTSTLSFINEDLPEIYFSVNLKNNDQRFNVDNPSSEINFLETGQNVSVQYGYELNDGTVEWQQLHTLLVSEWSADDTQATIKAVDRFKYMSDSYYKGQYYEDGISLYDLAVLVFEDAGVESSEYYIEPYLKNVIVHNPLPNVTHKEALQIIANAGRCILHIDRYGKIRLRTSFVPDKEISSNGTVYFSDVAGVCDSRQKNPAASYEQDFFKANGSFVFPVRSGIQSAYISEQISGNDCTFSENPIITIKLQSNYTCYGINIRFSSALPAEMIMRVYSGENILDTLQINEIESYEFEITHDFTEFDKMEIEFVKTENPNNRIHLDYIEFGSESGYTIEYDDLYSDPLGTQVEKMKNLNVSRQVYSAGTEDEELTSSTLIFDGETYIAYFSEPCYGYSAKITEGNGTATIVSSGVYFVEVGFENVVDGTQIKFTVTGRKYNVSESIYSVSINNRGTDTTWDNPLISDQTHCEDVALWLADYYALGIEYELDFRGEPALDCGDTIYQENKYVDDLETIVEEHQLTFDGGISGALRTIRKSFRVRQADDDEDIGGGDDYENMYDGSYAAGYLYLMSVMGSQIPTVFDYPVGTYRTTGYVEITGIDYLYSIVMDASTRQRRYYAYSYLFYSDASSNGFIGTVGRISGGTTVTGVEVPEGANYVRISQSATSMGSDWSNGLYIGESSNPDDDKFVTMDRLE